MRTVLFRVKALEGDGIKFREQLKTLIEKTDSDDQLIQALRQEIERLRTQNKKAAADTKLLQETHNSTTRSMKITAGGKVSTTVSGFGGNTGESELAEAELRRLTRMCAQQAQQLSTQEDIIKSLRSKI